MPLIRVAHSPDSDDAFMFYALAKDLLETGDLRFEHILSDSESLNREAFEGTTITALALPSSTRVIAARAMPGEQRCKRASKTAIAHRLPCLFKPSLTGSLICTGFLQLAICSLCLACLFIGPP